MRSRTLLIGGVSLALATASTASPSTAAATKCPSESGAWSALTPSYRMVLRIGASEKMYTLAQVKKLHPKTGELMTGGAMTTGMTGMAMNGTMRHLEVQICSRSTGAVLTDANPTITVVDSTAKRTTKVPVAKMRGVDAGIEETHYGNNLDLTGGHTLVVKVTLKGEQALFNVRMPMHM